MMSKRPKRASAVGQAPGSDDDSLLIVEKGIIYMKKIIAAIAAILTVANIGSVKTATCVALIEHGTGVTTAVYQTADGNQWETDRISTIGTSALLVMDDMGTENMADDEIKMIVTIGQ